MALGDSRGRPLNIAYAPTSLPRIPAAPADASQTVLHSLISDYFYPKVGGVESHIYSLAQSLAKRNHRVIVITHAYPPRSGVRWLPNGVKVYYVPVQPLPPTHVHATLPNFFTCLPYLRSIFLRESIDVVHAHAALSALGMEGIMHARAMGVRAVFTDHSLFGLGNMAEIWGNKMLKACLSDVEAVICVSHTGAWCSSGQIARATADSSFQIPSKENTVLRGSLNPSIVHVIPNAVVAGQFRPAEPVPPVPDILTIVCITRLVYRKGIDLLIAALPKVCALHPDVRFLIGALACCRPFSPCKHDADRVGHFVQAGTARKSLNSTRCATSTRPSSVIELNCSARYDTRTSALYAPLPLRLHPHPPSSLSSLAVANRPPAGQLLARAQIFLNPSLTEAFGIGILEAACAGLFVISTRVGGVPEVLPPGLVEFAEPEVDDLVRAISRAITHVRSGAHDPLLAHAQLRQVYSWTDVTERTERVYEQAMEVPQVPVVERLRRYYGTGAVFGKIMCIIVIVDYFLLAFLDWLYPRDEIDLAPKFDLERWKQICEDELKKESEQPLASMYVSPVPHAGENKTTRTE
ncbi:SPOSA6832_00631, partial [Sporobolomyces salmonicolor]